MKINNIELGYDTYYSYCIYAMTEVTVYVLIPKQLNPEINPNILKLISDNSKINIHGLEEDTNISDYNIYEYYKTFESVLVEPHKYYKQIYPEILDILKMK